MARRPKIALIGAGNIGGELAALAARRELGDIVLFDIPEKEAFAKGKALDLEQTSAVLGYDASIIGSANWADCAGSDVVIGNGANNVFFLQLGGNDEVSGFDGSDAFYFGAALTGLETPALVVLGPVSRYREILDWYTPELRTNALG